MKNTSTLLILVLLCSVELVFSGPVAIETGHKCCMKYETRRIPVAKVVRYYKTSSSCAKAALVFVTERGKHICVDPSDSFVSSQASRMGSRLTMD
ncbi:hypothetical protein AAFF_G00040280 [Aldrovandia affinis]|uniref:Chemokine interleukin-8-like domain-containing protein n=1 Tax=Aldrovandia affinis TaxID=143900 RepID=A0AAD7WFP8_9TELE|nr:hypothetical protein AAFF_G00040280 [Aldrovandia affinis]